MKLHLSFDGNQKNGVIFNGTYTGCLYTGTDNKPGVGTEYFSFMFTEVFDTPSFIQTSADPSTRRALSDSEVAEAKRVATNWVQPLGQEGNPTEEQVISKIRTHRNSLLSATDWTQLPDVDNEVSAAWVPYRSALRDITDQLGFPHDVQWPGKPNGL